MKSSDEGCKMTDNEKKKINIVESKKKGKSFVRYRVNLFGWWKIWISWRKNYEVILKDAGIHF